MQRRKGLWTFLQSCCTQGVALSKKTRLRAVSASHPHICSNVHFEGYLGRLELIKPRLHAVGKAFHKRLSFGLSVFAGGNVFA